MFFTQEANSVMKKEMRKKMLKLRNEIEPFIKNQKDQKIMLNFVNFLKSRKIRTVLLYASYGSEVDTWKIFYFCQENSIKTAFPKVLEKVKALELYWVNNLEQLSPGYKSILEPERGTKAYIEEIEVIVVPGIAFDINCYRIGYGGGFYDRLLLYKKGLAIGLAYEEQIVDRIPTESFDKRVDLIITDERMISCV